MLRMDGERVMRQRSLKPRAGTDIYLMNVPRRYAGTPEGEKCWFSLQGRLEGFLGELLHRSWDAGKESRHDGVRYQRAHLRHSSSLSS